MKSKAAQNYRILTRDTIKLIAILTMVLNHFAGCFWEPEQPFYHVFIYIGHFTAVTMCCFLVEGYHHTRSKKKYGTRLLVFALLSQLPFDLAFSRGKIPEFQRLNMIFTLFICFLVLVAMEYIRDRNLKILAVFTLTVVSSWSDWGILAPLFVIIFEKSYGSRRKTAEGFVLAALLDWLVTFASEISYGIPGKAGSGALTALADCAGILAAGAVMVLLYNGKKSERGGEISKWFFYLFYPLHLLLFGLIRISLI
ncbi:TraX family protein [Ruminococcus sp. 5_1_39BFAA]|uniref:TraX family protein n=1 Tax=Ruminococcus sp. 5_1_39BFAA TaxID=457412 RepID=UPI00356B0386